MEENEKTFEAYFSGKMRSAQANDFNTALEANPEFKKRYDEFVAIKEATKNIERDNFRHLLNEVGIKNKESNSEDSSSSSATIIPLLKRMGGIAAIFVLGFWGYHLMSSTNTEQLFAQNFETYETQTSRGDGMSVLKTKYDTGKYTEFINDAIEAPETPELNMMLANSYMNKAEWQNAINSLNKIEDDSSFRDQKYWYLGLIKFRTGNSQEAINHLNYLRSISNFKKSEIEEILSTIRK